jgi:hypothetical protein
MEDYFYVVAAWAMFSFGAGYLVRSLMGGGANGGGPRIPIMRRTGFSWARSDFKIPEPSARNTNVRLITDWQDAGQLDLDNRHMTFPVHDTRTGLDRSVTLPCSLVMRFLKLDTPKRAEWHGDVVEYGRLLAVAKHFGWTIPNGNGYEWAVWLGSRERRLRAFECWLSRGD